MGYWKFTQDGLKTRLESLRTAKKTAAKIADIHVCISEGNKKVGVIPSVSLLPVLDCNNCKKCKISCYDLRNDCNPCKPAVIASRARNSILAERNQSAFFSEIDGYIKYRHPRAFRWHIGGDIKNLSYFEAMVRLAIENVGTMFLTFTKNFKVVNDYLDREGKLPANLQIIFSGWPGMRMENPHNLPTSHPLMPDGTTSAPDGAKLCTGNCTECFFEKRLCWYLQSGESVVFPAH